MSTGVKFDVTASQGHPTEYSAGAELVISALNLQAHHIHGSAKIAYEQDPRLRSVFHNCMTANARDLVVLVSSIKT